VTSAQPGPDQDGRRAGQLAAVVDHLRTVIPAETADRLQDPDFDLREVGAFDSLAFLELLVWLESAHGVVIPDQELLIENLYSPSLIVDYLLAAEADRSSR
jgi:acyl carrier protein